jgi:hypothetical protein
MKRNVKRKLQFRAQRDSSAYAYDSERDMQIPVSGGPAVVPSLQAVARHDRSLEWLGLAFLALLLIFPLIVQYLPLGVREYLAATVR